MSSHYVEIPRSKTLGDINEKMWRPVDFLKLLNARSLRHFFELQTRIRILPEEIEIILQVGFVNAKDKSFRTMPFVRIPVNPLRPLHDLGSAFLVKAKQIRSKELVYSFPVTKVV